jgi:hypothetical protein
LNDGSIYAYEIDTESIHSSDPDSLTMVLIANGPEGIDKFNAAIDDLENSNPLALSGVDSLLDSHGHRDILAKVDAMMIK